MKLHKTGTASYPELKELPCGNGTEYELGQCLVLSDGAAALATGTTKPTHICYQKKTGATGETVAAILIEPSMEFKAKLSVAGNESLVPGAKITLADDGIDVTATTASGVATLVALDGTAEGDAVTVRFE